MIYKYTIPLPPITKKNSPQIFYMGARCPVCHKGKIARVMPSAAYLKYERAAVYYLAPKPKASVQAPCRVVTLFYMPTRRRVDLTNLMEAAHDVLVAAGILADDNNTIIASVDGSRVLYDKENPPHRNHYTGIGGVAYVIPLQGLPRPRTALPQPVREIPSLRRVVRSSARKEKTGASRRRCSRTARGENPPRLPAVRLL